MRPWEPSDGPSLRKRTDSWDLRGAYLLASALRLVGDVTALREAADEAGERLATFTYEVAIAFASPAALREFADRLPEAIGRLAAEYHRPDTPSARRYRFVAGGHPTITKEEPT